VLKNKHIIFVAVKSFSIEGLIVSGLQQLGATVDFFDERPSNTTIGKVMLRGFPRLSTTWISKHYLKILVFFTGRTCT